MADFVRRSGRKTTQITDLSQSDPGMEDLSLEEKKNRKKKQRVLNNLHAKEDESSKFLSDFNPSSDRKAKAKVTGRYSAAPTSSAKKNSIYDNKGVLLHSGLDLCDCLDDSCPGCHFPCPKCKSPKCGHECRTGRKWQYDSVELDGVPNSLVLNSHLVPIPT